MRLIHVFSLIALIFSVPVPASAKYARQAGVLLVAASGDLRGPLILVGAGFI